MNNENRNGLRTWTAIMLQGVCLFSFFVCHDTVFNEGLVATIDGYQFYLCVFQTFFHASMLNFFVSWISVYFGTVSSPPSYAQIIYTYIDHTDFLPPSGDYQRFPRPVCKPSLGTKISVWHQTLYFTFQNHHRCSRYFNGNCRCPTHRSYGSSSSPPHGSYRNVCFSTHHSHRWSYCWPCQSRHSSR